MTNRLLARRGNQGIVLIVVLIIIFLMSIVSATIFSQSMSQSKTAGSQVDEIVAEQLAKGKFWQSYANSHPETGGAFTPTPDTTVTLNGHQYSVRASIAGQDVTVTTSY